MSEGGCAPAKSTSALTLMVLIPYGTTCYNDAPAWGTRLILLANIAVFAAARLGVIDPEAWIQDWQDPLRPALIGASFLHLEWLHLVPNLLYLWVLGRIVEGAIGTLSFLLLSLAIILGANGLEAAVLFGESGGSLGASGLAFGWLAAAFLVAPRSKVHCFVVLFLPLIYRPSLVKMPLVGFTALILGIEVAKAAFTGFEPSSAFLHVAGATIGALLSYLGLKLRWLDAGDWDLFSLQDRKDRAPAKLLAKSARKRASKVTRCSACGRVKPPRVTSCVYCGSRW